MKTEKERKCKHKWEHKIIKGRSMAEKNKNVYEWLIHKCKKCGIETCEGRLN